MENVRYLGNSFAYLEMNSLEKLEAFFRYRLSEVSFVLKAITTLIVSMKKAAVDKG